MEPMPIRLRIGDLPENEIGTLTLGPGEDVYEATAAALRAAADLIASVPKLTAPAPPRRCRCRAGDHRHDVTPEPPSADVIDLATGTRLTPPAVGDPFRIFRDLAKGG